MQPDESTDEPATKQNLSDLEPDSMPDPEGQDYLDRSKLDFDPADGHYSGTAVDGSTEIPGPHQVEGDEPDAQAKDGPS